MTHPSNRPEELLRFYETLFFLNQVLGEHGMLRYRDNNDPIPFTGPVRHSQEFRRHLLDLLTVKGQRLSETRFMISDERMRAHYGVIGRLPAFLSTWTQHSRRVFHMTADLQALLSAMSFSKMKWGDVAFPFESFVITLEKPIVCGDESYDAIVVNTHDESQYTGPEEIDIGERNLSIALISQKVEGYGGMQSYDKRLWRNAVSLRKPNLKETLNRYLSGVRTKLPMWVSTMNVEAARARFASDGLESAIFTSGIGSTGDALREDGMQATIDDAFRLVAGLCLYLMSLPSGTPHRSGWNPAPASGKPDPRAITNEAQVCEVTSSFSLSPEEVEAFLAPSTKRGGKRGELSAHFRRGCYRKRAGEGHDPHAPKVILVSPSLVRRDRLKAGELPAGAVTRVK